MKDEIKDGESLEKQQMLEYFMEVLKHKVLALFLVRLEAKRMPHDVADRRSFKLPDADRLRACRDAGNTRGVSRAVHIEGSQCVPDAASERSIMFPDADWLRMYCIAYRSDE
eukprot:3622802-Amphidinium_carterae.1